MEFYFVNSINPSDKLFIIQNSFFSIRMENIGVRLGTEIDLIKFVFYDF